MLAPEIVVNAPSPPVSDQRRHALTWAGARQVAYDCAGPLTPLNVPLADAVGHSLVSGLMARQAIPHYASSAMDGWAINGSGPWTLTASGRPLAVGEASVIATGGLIPPGATAVLRKESGVVSGDIHLSLRHDAKHGETLSGRHIRPAGEEASAGEVLIPARTLLNPAHLALAAVAGYDELRVQRKPRVAVVLTGSEVVTSGEPAPGQVRDAFGPQLDAVISQLGGVPGGQLRIGDSYDEWLAALACASEGAPPDVTITTGGTGKSATDHFRDAVAALGGRFLLDGIAMRPGHPAVLAELPDGRFIVGLPGNPLAALMALMTLGEPLLAALGSRPFPAAAPMVSGADFDPAPGNTRLIPCTFIHDLALPASHTGPGMMRGLACADGYMVVPPEGVAAGAPVPVLPLPWTAPISSVDRRGRHAPWHA
ncbi:molybdopterin molybdotransferase MoeA [Paenarthrobacter aurescens]|uniref:molybdopterin molybdotransferase MoeA n=1 Tax=Paenarthrobacter aurescens TaxID=43663 RepID=UPI0021BE0591|nr:molybdopterin molybdotransferase MoeA [Paenarthrobacter aurescens]MCT9870483.1 molybdopterin molybdotransferase MoeA [Paenarthrobacter aurescens]